MTIPRIKRLAHLVLYVRNPEKSAAWYCDVLGMTITARVPEGPYKGGVFLSLGEADHDLAVFPEPKRGLFGGKPSRGREFEHFSFALEAAGDLEPLRRVYGSLLQKKVRIHEILDHGVSVGIYFYDPDGHLLEVFVQLVPTEGGQARAELGRNQGKAEPFELTPLYE